MFPLNAEPGRMWARRSVRFPVPPVREKVADVRVDDGKTGKGEEHHPHEVARPERDGRGPQRRQPAQKTGRYIPLLDM